MRVSYNSPTGVIRRLSTGITVINSCERQKKKEWICACLCSDWRVLILGSSFSLLLSGKYVRKKKKYVNQLAYSTTLNCLSNSKPLHRPCRGRSVPPEGCGDAVMQQPD